ncbi:glycosyltransferase [Methylobrevis pamukkalensis]|uniref:4'-demethylrebeccamycin synthase n=1 Tax=Methylobrevis pamukkalensis TaxID=1439726 RepID=A0A1E3H1K8_9HYPH|nr:glycosyltransferase [Methylobrevis pamukkalensis]ODN70025.1 4'-demethylrebeccamycin synthase [Methylobrevis pamukkalensis]
MPRSSYLFATHGSLGDLNPFLALGSFLRQGGSRVVIATHETYRARVEALDLEFVSIFPDAGGYEAELGMDAAAIVHRVSDDFDFFLRDIVGRHVEASIERLLPVVRTVDMVIASSYAHGAHIAAQMEGKRFVGVALQPAAMVAAGEPAVIARMPMMQTPSRRLDRLFNRAILAIANWRMRGALATVRQAYTIRGLKPEAGINGITADVPTLALFSPLLGGTPAQADGRSRMTGFLYLDDEVVSGEVERRVSTFLAAGPAPIVVTLGSFNVTVGERFFRMAIRATRRLGHRCIVIAGEASPLLGEDFGRQVLVLPYLPYARIFPHAAAIVHHGGIGTCAQALKAGRPQVVCPLFADQHDNAHRITRLGAGETLEFRRARPRRTQAALKRILESPEIDERCRSLAETIGREEGLLAAAAFLRNSVDEALPAEAVVYARAQA